MVESGILALLGYIKRQEEYPASNTKSEIIYFEKSKQELSCCR